MRRTTPPPRVLMWVAIGLSGALGGALVLLGVDDGSAWTTAAAVLFLACVGVCVWATAQGRVAEREVGSAVARLVATRREADHDREEAGHEAPEPPGARPPARRLHQTRRREP